MSWTSDVVDHMLESKRAGFTHREAWRLALMAHPPRGRDLGPVTPSLLPDPDMAESVVAFFQRATYDAWHGFRPELAHFDASLLAGADASEPAPRNERHRKLSNAA
jgi:hypothetical protein